MSIIIQENGSRALLIKSFSKTYQEKLDKIDKVNKNFIKIVKKGNIDEVINAIKNTGNTFRCEDNYCLIFCAGNGYFHLVKALVEYGYLKIQLKQKLSDIFKIALQKASVNGHIDIVKYLFKIGGSNCKEHIRYISLRNYNYVKNFDTNKTDNKTDYNYLKRIKNAQDSIYKISVYNKSHKRHKNSIMNENELLLDYHNDNDGLEYDENYKFEDEENEETNDIDEIDDIEENKSDNESDNDEKEIDIDESDNECEIEDENDLFGESDNESEIGLNEIQKKKKILIKKNVTEVKLKAKKPTFISKQKLKRKSKSSYMTDSDKKSKTLEVVLWYLSQDIMVNTDYNFISNYCYKHKLTDILEFLKKNNKLRLNLDDFQNLKI